MIVCHKYKFIFLKTSKTAGTSVEIALSRFCEEGDVVTPVSEEDEPLRDAAGGVQFGEYLASRWRYHPLDWYRLWRKGKRKLQFYNHIPARKLRSRLPADVWDGYYKFCIERNPWDRVISQYFWRYRNLQPDQRPSMDAFLSSTHVRSLKRKGYDLYTIGKKVQADYICRFESLQDDLETVRTHLKLPERLVLPSAKSGHRKDKRRYQDILTPAQRDRIATMFSEEIALMGYEY